LTGATGLTWGQTDLGRRLGIRRPRSSARAGGGRYPAASGGARRRATASGGATRIWRWGAPFVAGFALGRPKANSERQGELQRRRRGPRAAHGGEARWRQSGEVNPARRCTREKTNDTVFLLTFLRSSRGCPQRLRGGGGAEQRRRRARVSVGGGSGSGR
jgi:hypothetical protein